MLTIMMEIDLLIFDLDGTLAATGDDLAGAVNYTLRTLGMEELERKLILSNVGDGVQELVRRTLGPDKQEAFAAAMPVFLAYYGEHLLDKTVLYPGVQEVLACFAKKKKVLISNKHHDFTCRIVARLGIDCHFDAIVGGDSYPYKKPDARLAAGYLERYGVDPGRAVVVGDGPNDILLAKNAGMVSCAFLNGLIDRERLLPLQPDFTCEDLNELCGLFS